MKRLHRLGLGANVQQAEPITDEEEALLWSSGQQGTHSAHALLNSVYYYNCKIFALRSYDEHRKLLCTQFEKKVDEQNGVYMQYTEFGSKTNQGGLKHMKFQNKHVRQYADSEAGERCVVHIFDTYLSYIIDNYLAARDWQLIT